MSINLKSSLEKILESSNEKTIEYIIELHKQNKLDRLSRLLSNQKYLNILNFFNQKSTFVQQEKKENLDVGSVCKETKKEEIELFDRKKLKKLTNNFTLKNEEEALTEKKFKECILNINDCNFEEKIVKIIKENRVTIIQGETGTGKSTLVPLALIKHFTKIVVTQPRRLAAVSICERVRELYMHKFMQNENINQENLKKSINEQIGYKVRFEDHSHRNNKLLYCTDGILLQNYQNNYDLLIIDEVHERSLNIDLLLSLYQYFNSNIKLVLMSATINLEKFIKFFDVSQIITLQNDTFPVDIFYLRNKSEDYLLEIEELLRNLIKNYQSELKNELLNNKLNSTFIKSRLKKSMNILVFLPGKEEIFALKEKFAEFEYFFILHGDMKIEEMNKIYEERNVKVILATNIGETSITIKDLDCVIDSGFYNQMYCNRNINQLITQQITKSMAQQRKGRVGRVKSGIVFRIYTKEEFSSFKEHNIPEILISKINSVILKVLNLKIDIFKFNFIEEIKKEEIFKSILFLQELGLVNDNKITNLGIKVNYLPLEIELGRVLVESSKYNNELEVTILVSLLSSTPFKNTFFHKNGDFFSMIYAFKEWMQNNFSIKFLEKKELSKKSFILAKSIFFQLKRNKFLKSNESYLDLIRVLLLVYNKNICKRIENHFINIFTGTVCYLHPNSIEVEGRYVIYDEIIKTKKVYMKSVGVLPNEIIKELGLEYS